MISERYEYSMKGLFFAPTPLLQTSMTSKRRTTTRISQHMNSTATDLFSCSMPPLPVYSTLSAPPPSAYGMRTCRLKGDRRGSIEEALTVDVQARAFDGRNLIVDLRVRSRQHLPWLCVLLNTFAFDLHAKFRSLGMKRSFSLI